MPLNVSRRPPPERTCPLLQREVALRVMWRVVDQNQVGRSGEVGSAQSFEGIVGQYVGADHQEGRVPEQGQGLDNAPGRLQRTGWFPRIANLHAVSPAVAQEFGDSFTQPAEIDDHLLDAGRLEAFEMMDDQRL